MNQYIIVKNEYLNKDIKAFYRCAYYGLNQPDNPSYLNILKNTFGNEYTSKLLAAKNSVQFNLANEISNILSNIEDDEVTICVVPRSKSLNSYNGTQLKFAEAIREMIPLVTHSKNKLVDGSDFIVRHTDTCTTHLSRSSIGGGSGRMPYIGITKDTCTISEKVRGKHILLIDDIYTKNVNIDEDAIQCLLDCGAKDVTFFSIARVPHYTFQDDFPDEIVFATKRH